SVRRLLVPPCSPLLPDALPISAQLDGQCDLPCNIAPLGSPTSAAAAEAPDAYTNSNYETCDRAETENGAFACALRTCSRRSAMEDRKSRRLNSSHGSTSYDVFW